MDKKEKRISRCLCLKILYANSFSESSFKDLFNNFFNKKNKDFDSNLSQEQIKYASELFELVIVHNNEIDEMIKSKLVNWEISRLAMMDRIILQMSATEMLYMDSIPPKVSIAEGVEIAKEFSTDDSSSFVNGILDAIYNDNLNSKD